MNISTMLIYEKGVFRPLQPLQLRDKQVFKATLAPAREDELGAEEARLDMLSAELGFDVRDEAQWQAHIAAQRRAWEEVFQTMADEYTGIPNDGARRHDYYIYEQRYE